MPTYEYRCGKCGHQFEVFHSISAEPVSKCPECTGKVERLISGGIGFISSGSDSSFKGSDSCSSCSTPASCSTCGSH